jgi:arylsulfatase A-like enzyme
MAGYQGAIRKVDAAVAVILDALRQSGLDRDTIVVFSTDHGIEMPRSKWFLYDPGIAIGAVLRYPAGGLVGGRTWDGLSSNVDYVPTLLELAQLDVPARLEGRSFADGLRPGTGCAGREAIFAMHNRSNARCVRTRRHKLIRYFDSATDFAVLPVRFEDVMMRRGIPLVGLYDLEADPNEFVNLVGRPETATVQADLDARLWKWMEAVNDPLLAGPIASPSYLAAVGAYAASRLPPCSRLVLR